MGKHVEAGETLAMQIPSMSQTAYIVNFKLKVTRCIKETNNCIAFRKYSNFWGQLKRMV
jgi:hypothetical protein